ncbi:energy transducer TonB [Luteimonas sp. A478]
MRIWLAMAAALLVAPAMAQSPQQVRRQAEASMVVTGHVDIGADGTLSGYVLHKRDDLPGYVVELVDTAARSWRFEPVEVDGQPVAACARMSLRMLARPLEDGGYEVSIASGRFGEYSDNATDHVTRRDMAPPRYPNEMSSRGVQGTVYLLVKVGRDGTVEDVVTERVNLRAYASGREMERWRRVLAASSINTARRWEFNPPTTGDQVDADYWVIRIPVEYGLSGQTASGPSWQQYVPGPELAAPDWLHVVPGAPRSDAQVAGGIEMIGRERRLLTPLQG